MFRFSHNTKLITLLMLSSLLLAACGAASAQTPASSINTEVPPAPASSGEISAAPSPNQSAQIATVLIGDTSLGKVLTNSDGMTLYLFQNDTAGQSNCTGSCAQLWPAATVPQGVTPTAGPGITGKLGVIQRADGSYQVTINGMPLYLYSGDSKPGDTNGQGIKGIWHVVDAAGNPITAAQPSSSGGY